MTHNTDQYRWTWIIKNNCVNCDISEVISVYLSYGYHCGYLHV